VEVQVQVEVAALTAAAAKEDRRTTPATARMESATAGDMTMITTVGHADLISSTAV
jgi:hypothetical protein